MASISSTNVNEILPGLEDFLRSMLSSTHLDTDHRQIAAMYLDKLDQHTQSINQQSSYIDDQSLMNTDEESDDFTDEEEQQQQTPTVKRHPSQLYDSTKQEYNSGNSQQYTDVPTNDYLEPQVSNEHNENSSITMNGLYTPIPSSSTIIADGLLLTYDKNHNWIWRYYVLDDFDLICFPADKKSQSKTQGQSDNTCSPLWVSDITNAKVHTTIIDKHECLCLYIGVAEAIYVRPSDPNQLNIWLKAFRDAASSQKSKDHSKTRRNVNSLSRNARRMFAQFNRKKGQIVSHFLDQMANVTGIDDKARKHYELRGFLVISLDNSTFVTKYCTIVDGIFRIHKSRLSDQTDHQFNLNHCKLSFPEERTRDIQFALINEQIGTIFIRGNNIYSMGRLLNTLAKYVVITGSSQSVFQSNESVSPTLSKKYRPTRADLSSQSNENYSSPNVKSIPKKIYPSASKLHDEQMYVLPTRQTSNRNDRKITPIQQGTIISSETYDRPKSYDNITSVDGNNNHVAISPKPRERRKFDNSYSESRSAINISESHRNYSPDRSSISSSHADPIFCIRSPISASSQHRISNRHRRPYPLPRRTSLDYVNKFTNLFTRNSNERQSTTQLHNTNSSRIQPNDQPISKHAYDIPITIERPTRLAVPSFERYQKSTCTMDEDTVYDNISKSDGTGKFRFVIPFSPSSRSAFTAIKSMNSPSDSSSSTTSSNSILPYTSPSSNNSNTNNNNNNNNNRTRLITAV